MSISENIIIQVRLHPSMTAQDIVKMCYQAAFGADHMISDIEAVSNYFYKEYESVLADANESLVEKISENVCRVNMRAWKATKMNPQWLLNMFILTASVTNDGKHLFEEYLSAAEMLVRRSEISVSREDWDTFMKEYRQNGMPAVHHSEAYRKAEKPAYRIVKSDFVKLFDYLQEIAENPNRIKDVVKSINDERLEWC